jgi:hypothetical protein
MNVFLVPASSGTYQLYCEVASSAPADDERAGTIRARLVDGFRRLVAEGEDAERGQPAPERGRLRRAITRRIAGAVAEQRLLWHLRQESSVRLVHPDDMSGADGLAAALSLIAVDYAKHRRWCAIDALVVAVTGPLLFFVPGPNIVSWYFAFRAIGHYFAMRGASKGLSGMSWNPEPARALSDLRAALSLDREARAHRVDEIARNLGLDRLSFFVQKIA